MSEKFFVFAKRKAQGIPIGISEHFLEARSENFRTKPLFPCGAEPYGDAGFYYLQETYMTAFYEKIGGLSYKIVVDSAADMHSLSGLPFASAPLKIIAGEREYRDDGELDVRAMVSELAAYSGRSSSSCPSVGDWLEAFGDAERVLCFTITGTLSGSYNSACMAKEDYEERYPERCVFVLNTLTAGPEIKLIAEYARDLVLKGTDYAAVCAASVEYSRRTALLFMLGSMKNLANNGRVKPIVAKAAGLLGIRVVGKASDKGDLEPLDKCRGEKKALEAIVHRMKVLNFSGGKVKIAHCFNAEAAQNLKELILTEMPDADIEIYPCGGLCSFYAEEGGLLVGLETAEE